MALVAVAVVIAATVIGTFAWQRDSVGTPGGEDAPAGEAPAVAQGNPPPAYVEFGKPGKWLAQGSSCWASGTAGACVDAASPSVVKGLPTVLVAPGSIGRIHLGFSADKIHLSIGGKAVPSTGTRTIAFRAKRPGIIEIFTNHGSDDASYYGRIAFAAGSGSAAAPIHWKRFSDSNLTFRYPGTWRLYTWGFYSSFTTPLVYLSTGKEHKPCTTHATKRFESTSCGPALEYLEPSGVFVTWSVVGMPTGSYKSFPGIRLDVGGQPARLEIGAPESACAHIGGSRSVAADIRTAAAHSWVEMNACLSGPDIGVGLAQVKAMLASTRWTR